MNIDQLASDPFRPVIVEQARAVAHERPWPVYQVGTGGSPTTFFYAHAPGYRPFVLVVQQAHAESQQPFAHLMEQIKAGFGRTMSRLPPVFGVTRQTLYNWLAGETPKATHHDKLRELAAAAQVFSEQGFRPNALALDRTLAEGKSILELLAGGADGRLMAQRLVKLDSKGGEARSKLELLTARRPARDDAPPFSPPAFKNEA